MFIPEASQNASFRNITSFCGYLLPYYYLLGSLTQGFLGFVCLFVFGHAS